MSKNSKGENVMGKMVNVGFGNVINVDRIIAIMTPDAAQTKRAISRAKDEGKFLDASHGRSTRSVIITDSGHIILSALIPITISERISRQAVCADTEKEN